jgi:hypothetical protein
MFDASFGVWLQLLGGALAVGVVGLALTVVEKRKRVEKSRSSY